MVFFHFFYAAHMENTVGSGCVFNWFSGQSYKRQNATTDINKVTLTSNNSGSRAILNNRETGPRPLFSTTTSVIPHRTRWGQRQTEQNKSRGRDWKSKKLNKEIKLICWSEVRENATSCPRVLRAKPENKSTGTDTHEDTHTHTNYVIYWPFMLHYNLN